LSFTENVASFSEAELELYNKMERQKLSLTVWQKETEMQAQPWGMYRPLPIPELRA